MAKDLNKLHTVTFDHIDVTTFLKEMSLLKTEVARVSRTEPTSSVSEEIESLKIEIRQLKELVHDIRAENCLSSQQC